jgi:hypothetical protein
MKVEDIKLAFETNIQFAGTQDIFNSIKGAKAYVGAVNTDMSSASSKLQSARNEYSKTKTIADKFLADLRALDPELVNSPQGKIAVRWAAEVDSDLKTVMELQSNISKIGSIASKFKI